MSTTITPNFMTYEEWLKVNPDIEEKEEVETCSECDGKGEVKCWHCGHTTDCEECSGTGKIKTNEAREIYEQQRKRDTQLLQKHLAWSQSNVTKT